MGAELQVRTSSCSQITPPASGVRGERALRISRRLGHMFIPKLATLTLFLLIAAIACRGPQFVFGPTDAKHLQTHRTFSIDPGSNKNLVIWNMRPISSEELRSMVTAQFREKGYIQAPPEEADLRIILSTFADNSLTTTHSISLVIEIVDRVTLRQLWSGHAELPWAEDPKGLSALQQCLGDFMKYLPARAEVTKPGLLLPSPSPASANRDTQNNP